MALQHSSTAAAMLIFVVFPLCRSWPLDLNTCDSKAEFRSTDITRVLETNNPTGTETTSSDSTECLFGYGDGCVEVVPTVEYCTEAATNQQDPYCHCDAQCQFFGDCCYGYSTRNASLPVAMPMSVPAREYWKCFQFALGLHWRTACFYNFLLVGKCPSDANENLRRFCEIPLIGDDEVVFDMMGTFYRNGYCAQCHGVNASQLTPYIIFRSCLDALPYEERSCGCRLFEVDGVPPPEIRSCPGENMSIISYCSQSGDSEADDSRLCLNETAIITVNGTVYKNLACAKCNGIQREVISIVSTCKTPVFKGIVVLADNSLSIYSIVYSIVNHFRPLRYYPKLQCANGLVLQGSMCFPENATWPSCQNRTVALADFSDGLLQCFQGIEALSLTIGEQGIDVLNGRNVFDHQNGYFLRQAFYAGGRLPHQTDMEDFVDGMLEEGRGDEANCCRDRKIVLSEICIHDENLPSSVSLMGDWTLFQPIMINKTTHILYNDTTIVYPAWWRNETYYTRPTSEWTFSKQTVIVLYGRIVDVKTCAFIIVDRAYFGEEQRGNMTYLLYQNVYIPPDQYVILKDGGAKICWSQFPASLFQYSVEQQILGNVLFACSTICLLATFCVYCVFTTLRNLQGICVMNMVAALFLAQVFNQFVSAWVDDTPVLCQLVAILSHLTFLSVFSWTNILAWDLARQFGTPKLVLMSGSHRKRLVLYSGLGWGAPLLLVTFCMVVHFTSPKILEYGGPSCWLEPNRANILAFLVPVAVSLLGNVALFCWTSYGLRKSRSESEILHRDVNDQRRKNNVKELLVYVKISCLLGLGWLFGFIAFFADTGVLWYVFIIISSLQGVSIFIFFGTSERVRILWRQRWGKRSALTTVTDQESLSSRCKSAKDGSAPSSGRPNIISLAPPQGPSQNIESNL